MNEKELIADCLKGDQRAQKALYIQYRADLFGLCLRYAQNRDEAHDILQEGFVKIFGKLHLYQPICPVIHWMKKVMVNSALEHIRKHKKHQQSKYELNEQIIDSGFEVADVQNAAELIELIQRLPEDYRLVFNLYAIEGYGHKEIAEMLSISVGTSKSQLFHAKKCLRKMLENMV